MENKNELYAYMAGFVDADGSISVISLGKLKRSVTRITVANCNLNAISLFTKEFGGKLRARHHKNHKNWRRCYEWSLTSVKAQNVIKVILPYLQIKKRQGVLALRLGRLKAKHRGATRRWHPEIDAKCKRVYQKIKDECKRLNRRGVVHEDNQ